MNEQKYLQLAQQMRGFKVADDGEDYDRSVSVRTFSGRMTRKRWAILSHYARVNSFHTHCGHEWDCCGCLCGQSVNIEYRQNQVIVTLTQSFNY